LYRWIGGIAVAVVLLGVGVGCGGGSDDTTPEISKAQFVKKAKFICADYKAKRLAAAEKFNQKQQQGPHVVGAKATEEFEAEMKAVLEKVVDETIVPLTRTEQEKLEALGAPAGDEEKIEQMIESLDGALEKIEDEGVKGLLAENGFEQFEKEAEKYGLTCKFA